MQLTAPNVMSTDTAVISITDCDFVYCSPKMNPRATGGNLKTVKSQKEFRANPIKEAKEKESAKLKAKIMTEESDGPIYASTPYRLTYGDLWGSRYRPLHVMMKLCK